MCDKTVINQALKAMTTTRKITDSAVPSVSSIADTALVAVFDPTTGKASRTTFEALKQAVRDSIKIGGRNYLLNSERKTLTNATYGVCKVGELSEPMKVGDTYIISCEEKSEELSNIAYLTVGATTSSDKRSIEFDTPFVAAYGFKYVWIWANNKTLTGAINMEVKKMKVECGNIVTDWTPAPEDNWGGVIFYLSATCEKGEPRHDRNEGAHERGFDRHVELCNGLPGSRWRSRLSHKARHLHHERKYSVRESSFGDCKRLEVFDCGSDGAKFDHTTNNRKAWRVRRNSAGFTGQLGKLVYLQADRNTVAGKEVAA